MSSLYIGILDNLFQLCERTSTWRPRQVWQPGQKVGDLTPFDPVWNGLDPDNRSPGLFIVRRFGVNRNNSENAWPRFGDSHKGGSHCGNRSKSFVSPKYLDRASNSVKPRTDFQGQLIEIDAAECYAGNPA